MQCTSANIQLVNSYVKVPMLKHCNDILYEHSILSPDVDPVALNTTAKAPSAFPRRSSKMCNSVSIFSGFWF